MRVWAAAAALAIAFVGSGYANAYISGLSGVLNDEISSSIPLINGSMNLLASLVAIALFSYAFMPKKPSVHVLDFSVFSPPESWKFARTKIRPLCETHGGILPEHIDFLEKIAYRTGLGDDTAVVPVIQDCDLHKVGIEACRQEFRDTCFGAIEELLEKTGVKANQINFVITNSSLFNPTPSLSTTVMNHFKMSTRCKGYSLGGMGCSAGVIAIDLAREMLELYPNSYVLVVSHENITNAFYAGKDPSMLLINCLFRANGCAVLLTNKPKDARRSKYKIQHIVRTNLARDDTAFNCVVQTQDEEGICGVRLNKDIVQVGTRALKDNMTALGPLVLPLSEKLLFAGNYITRQLARKVKPLKGVMPAAWTKPYIPDFTKAFDFYCIHTGGRGIIDGLEKELKLTRPQVEPSRASLYRFGNTSSTSVWYELAFSETFQGVPRGSRVWQLAFGSGFKFNSSVMIANRSNTEQHKAWKGFDKAAMWLELEALEASAKAAREAKARKAAEAADAEKIAAEKPAEMAEKPAIVSKASVSFAPEPASVFGTPEAAKIAQDLPDTAPGHEKDQGPITPIRSLRSSRSVRMRGLKKQESMLAVASGTVSVDDMSHLEAEVDVEIPVPEDEADPPVEKDA